MLTDIAVGRAPHFPKPSPRTYRRFCLFLAIVVAAFFSAKTVALFFEPAEAVSETVFLPEEPAAAGQDQEIRRIRPSAEYEAIVSNNIFGGSGSQPPVKQEIDIASIPQAVKSLNLNLVGTALASSPDNSVAVIQDTQKKEQKLYREGDKIKNVTVKRILRNSVIINNGTRDEVLTMEEKKTERSGNPARSRAGHPPVRASQQSIDHQMVDESLGNLATLMQDAQINAYFKNGQPAGFQLSQIRPGSFYTRLGLQNNDILLSVNGQGFTDPSDLLTLRENLGEQDVVTLTIRRNGRDQEMQYNVE
jgi:type II secretion system protein C